MLERVYVYQKIEFKIFSSTCSSSSYSLSSSSCSSSSSSSFSPSSSSSPFPSFRTGVYPLQISNFRWFARSVSCFSGNPHRNNFHLKPAGPRGIVLWHGRASTSHTFYADYFTSWSRALLTNVHRAWQIILMQLIN
jgi:hypothetical protein